MKYLQSVTFLTTIRFLIIFFVFQISPLSFSQTYSIKHYSIEEGLASRNVMDITQDKSNRIWVATNVGVSMFDGFVWKNINISNLVKNSRLFKVKCDEKGVIWAVPSKFKDSIICYKNGVWQVYGYLNDNNNEMSDITCFDVYYEADNPVLCFGTIYGLAIYKSGVWSYFDEKNGLLDKLVNNVTAHNNNFYITSKKGIIIYKNNGFDYSLNEIIKNHISELLTIRFEISATGTEKLWILGLDKLGYIENNNFKILQTNFKLPDYYSFHYPSLVVDKRNNIFLGNMWARYLVDKTTGHTKVLSNENGFTINAGPVIFIDKEENIWFGDSRGLDKLSNLVFKNYDYKKGLPEIEVASINELKNGKMILGHNNGFSVFDGVKFDYVSFESYMNYSPNASRVLDIFCDKNGEVYLSASLAGLAKLKNDNTLEWIESPKGIIISSAISTDSDEIIVSGSSGCYTIVNNKLVPYKPLSSLKTYIRKLFKLKDGSIYIASSEGTYVFNNGSLKHYFLGNSINANNIYSVLKDDKNNILIGTNAGLLTVEKDSVKQFTSNGFIINDPVYSIIQDKTGNYWFGTQKDLIRWDGKDKVIKFNSKNGLVPGEISRSALFEDSRNNIWIGTDAGMSTFIPELENKNVYIPSLEILNFEDINGTEYSPFKEVKLRSFQNSVKFNFRAISFVEESSISYKIKLEGHDEDWVLIQQNQIGNIVYKNLPSGDYIFKVMAKNHNSQWSDVVSTKTISILSPSYLSWWFILISIIVICGLTYLLFRFYINKKYLSILEQKVQKRTEELTKSKEELNKALLTLEDKVKERTFELAQLAKDLQELNASKDKFFSIMAHDLRNPFTSVLGYSDILYEESKTLSRDDIKSYAFNIKRSAKNTFDLLENLLLWGRMNTGRLMFSPGKVNLYNRVDKIVNLLTPMAQIKEITIINNIKDIIFIEGDKFMLQTILQNLITNAIKFSKRKDNIEISCNLLEDFVKVNIKDYGVGISKDNLNDLFKIDKTHSSFGTEKEVGTGLGLIICKDMVERQGGKIKVVSTLGEGSTFSFYLKKWTEKI